ncbi:PLDc N-terminal domain-containing protein [Conyzicola sp.]|uniref:PLDc N-terminal domain-containing protein n=1 Tax=Conyzicola sp. TaxID=1969404 RepID=UPI003988AA08
MDDTKNPLIPPVYDVLWVVTPVLALALTVVALVSISRTAHRSITELFVWIAIVIFVPVFGPIGWLLVKRSLPKTAG